MGGRINKAGNQSVYYCVKKERRWKTRAEDHPKWKRGIECSMVRSVNIEKTNQYVWNLINHSPFRREDKKNTLHVTFSEATQRVINAIRKAKSSSVNNGNDNNENSESFCEARIKDRGVLMGETTEALRSSPDDIVRLFGDGGVRAQGLLLQRSCAIPENSPCGHIGPITLDIRPLSPYQASFITTILRLRSEGWLDHHIAKYFNDSGYLTSRGCSWVPQSVFSIRRNYQRRLERLVDGDGDRKG
jgi:hypothetical protein